MSVLPWNEPDFFLVYFEHKRNGLTPAEALELTLDEVVKGSPAAGSVLPPPVAGDATPYAGGFWPTIKPGFDS